MIFYGAFFEQKKSATQDFCWIVLVRETQDEGSGSVQLQLATKGDKGLSGLVRM